jgi:hypothetical protein
LQRPEKCEGNRPRADGAQLTPAFADVVISMSLMNSLDACAQMYLTLGEISATADALPAACH